MVLDSFHSAAGTPAFLLSLKYLVAKQVQEPWQHCGKKPVIVGAWLLCCASSCGAAEVPALQLSLGKLGCYNRKIPHSNQKQGKVCGPVPTCRPYFWHPWTRWPQSPSQPYFLDCEYSHYSACPLTSIIVIASSYHVQTPNLMLFHKCFPCNI